MFLSAILIVCYGCIVMAVFIVDFSVMVLSSVAWPFTQGPPFTVPEEVSNIMLYLVLRSSGNYSLLHS